MVKTNSRLEVRKTYKMYVDGKFPRSESGRYYKLEHPNGQWLANICLGSRKDFRDAVVAARKAFAGWQSRSAFNRSQILYRIAETMEGRAAQLTATLESTGIRAAAARIETEKTIDLIVHYAGWADKYQQLFSSVNPVESSHFNFSYPEPTGVVAVLPPTGTPLFGLAACLLPAITGGNTVIALADETAPLAAIEFAEIIHASDVPAGVINLLTGKMSELLQPFVSHMDVNAVCYGGTDPAVLRQIEAAAPQNVRRVIQLQLPAVLTKSAPAGDPYAIMDFQEIKTTWHPVAL